MDTCRILAWADWKSEAALSIVQDDYRREYKRDVAITFEPCMGGGALIKSMSNLRQFDIVIGDRELLWAFADRGELLPFGLSVKGDKEVLRTFPSWLRPFCLYLHGRLIGVPLRWGTTSLMVKREVLKRMGNEWKIERAASDAESFLFWSPENYFLYPMGVISASINPTFPYNLTPTQFGCLTRTTESIARRNMFHASLIQDFIKKMESEDFDVIVCPGEWILGLLAQKDQTSYEKMCKSYEYLFPGKANSTLAFFETVALVNNYSNEPTKHRVAKLLSSDPVRRALVIGSGTKENFYSNPTFGDPNVIGPGFRPVAASTLVPNCRERCLPTNHILVPQFLEWEHLWQQFGRDAKMLTKGVRRKTQHSN